MRRSKELMSLLAILLLAAALASWYAIARRRTTPAPAPAASPVVVDLAKHDGQTIDFSSGKAKVKNTAEDKAALEAGLKDIEAAAAQVTFVAPVPTPTPPGLPPGKK